jgi:hypothetical protein
MRELQTQSKRCGDFELEVTPLPAGKALQVARRLGKTVAPALTKLSALDTKSIGLEGLGEALQELFNGLSDDDVSFVNKAFAEGTTIIDGDARAPLARQFDVHFQGALDAWWEWMRFSLEVNFGPLVKGLGASVGARAAKVAG